MSIQKSPHRRLYILCLILLLAFILPSCSQEEVVNSQQKEEEETQEPIITAGEGVEVEFIPDENVDVDPEFLDNLYNFTEKASAILLNKDDKNQVYAPINSYLALSVLAEMTNGQAREEILDALSVDDIDYNQLELVNSLSALTRIRGIDTGEMSINNSLWLNEEINYKDGILSKLEDKYSTEIYKGIFTDKDYQDKITNWVYENTGQAFSPDFNLSDMDEPGGFISINTLDFNNQWLTPFEEEDTSIETFYLDDGTEVECEFMKNVDPSTSFLKGDNYLSTSYWLLGHEGMIFILPDEGVSVEDILMEEGKLSSIISDWANDNISMGEVSLSVPKFDYSVELDLLELANAMGIKKTFNTSSNAFSDLTDTDLYVSQMKQATKIGIDEKGCRASSYTSVNAFTSGVWDDKVEMNLNRPFIYVLYKDGVPFITGVVRNPLSN